MTVTIAFTQSDLPVAESLKAYLEAQAFPVILAEEASWHTLPPGAAVIALWSKETPFSVHRLAYEKLALDAWADGRLIFVKLDAHFAPIGLRDLPFVDALFEAQRDLVAWREIAIQLRAIHQSQTAAVEKATPLPPAPPAARPDVAIPKKPGDARSPLWLRILCSHGLWCKPERAAPPAAAPASGSAQQGSSSPGSSIFISYARADSAVVRPICEDLQRRGQQIWVDTQQINAGDGWAGEIVRAIKSVNGVAVMCSKAAFESDHVRREVHLADRYKRRILPVFIEDAPIPEDFEYFFAGIQWLKLNDTPLSERGLAVANALS